MKALVVDDNSCLRTLFQMFLQNLGFVTDEAADGDVAFQKIQQEEYDCIMCDMEMPQVSGQEFYSLVESYFPEKLQRIFFATGSSLDGEHREFFDSIACPVLQKPFTIEELKEVLETSLGVCCHTSSRKKVA